MRENAVAPSNPGFREFQQEMTGETPLRQTSGSSQLTKSQAVHRSPTWLKLPKKEPISSRLPPANPALTDIPQKPTAEPCRTVVLEFWAAHTTLLCVSIHPPSLPTAGMFMLWDKPCLPQRQIVHGSASLQGALFLLLGCWLASFLRVRVEDQPNSGRGILEDT